MWMAKLSLGSNSFSTLNIQDIQKGTKRITTNVALLARVIIAISFLKSLKKNLILFRITKVLEEAGHGGRSYITKLKGE
jgi:hypothetical protein